MASLRNEKLRTKLNGLRYSSTMPPSWYTLRAAVPLALLYLHFVFSDKVSACCANPGNQFNSVASEPHGFACSIVALGPQSCSQGICRACAYTLNIFPPLPSSQLGGRAHPRLVFVCAQGKLCIGMIDTLNTCHAHTRLFSSAYCLFPWKSYAPDSQPQL